jgi:hypothetical protein
MDLYKIFGIVVQKRAAAREETAKIPLHSRL